MLFFLSFPSFASVSFYNINELLGISIRETTSTCSDDLGFVWVSSKSGILRLAEDDAHIYHLPYDSPDVISVKLVYKNSRLFAYTNNGQIFEYNVIFDRFDFVVNIGKSLKFSFLLVHNIQIDSHSNILISSNSGLIKYDFIAPILFSDKGIVSYIEWFNDQSLILATENELILFDVINETVVSKIAELPNKLSSISKMFFDSDKKLLWIGTKSSGLYIYDFYSKSFTSVEGVPKQPILAMDFISDSTLLVGVDGQGLWEVHKSSHEILNVYKENSDNPNSIRGNGVYDIFYDNNSRVWICTYSGGVSYFNKTFPMVTHVEHIINETNSLINNDVNDVLEDSRGFLWFATNNGLSRWDVSSKKWESFYHNKQEQAQVFLSLCEDSSGNIWAGTYASGVYLLNGATGEEIKHLHNDSDTLFTNNFVFDIISDKDKNIWIVGVSGDVICYSFDNKQFKSYGVHPVYVIKEYSNNEMLLGCTYGLSILNKETGKVRILLNGYLVHDLFVEGTSVWLCTSGEGLIHYDLTTQSVTKYDTEFGLPSNFVNSIIEDNGCFWLGTENGIFKFDPSNRTIETFPAIRALWRLSFNSNSRYKRSNGEIMLGTNKGAVIFNPSLLFQSSPKGKIYMQDIKVLGRSMRTEMPNELVSPIDSLRFIKLKHTHNTLSIEIVPLGMSFGAKFSWLLEGIDSEWSKPINNRVLNYTNLPTGKYTLKIRMYDNSLSQIIDERFIEISKEPPFWRTWWFLSIVTIVLLGTFILSMKYYIGLINQFHSKEKIRFFTNTAHDMRTSLTLIKAPLDEISHDSKLTESGINNLELAKRQVEKLTKVVAQLMDFQKADIGKEQLLLTKVDLVNLIAQRVTVFKSVANSSKIELKFLGSVKACFTLVDQSMIEKVVDNLLSNAIKYSNPESNVELNLSVIDSHWILEVKDYGIGISKEVQRKLFKEFYRGDNAINSKVVGSGIGLLLAKKYVTLHKGKLVCSSELNRGTTFKVIIPLNEISTEEIIPNNLPEVEGFVRSEISMPEEVNAPKPFTVIVIEDNDDLRSFLEQALQTEYLVITASNGEEGWRLIQQKLPDLIVSDIMMSQMDGFHLCHLVKSTYEVSHIPVILLTALADKSDQMQGLGLGADDYLTKPFDISLLKQRIRSIISNRIAVRNKALKLVRDHEVEPILSNQLNDQFVKKALDIVRANISNTEFNKDNFAAELNVSGSLLYKKIKSLTDQSPTDFIKSIRLTNSLELLQSRKYSITEVSELCGFSSVGYFSTVFKKHFGKSPSDILGV